MAPHPRHTKGGAISWTDRHDFALQRRHTTSTPCTINPLSSAQPIHAPAWRRSPSTVRSELRVTRFPHLQMCEGSASRGSSRSQRLGLRRRRPPLGELPCTPSKPAHATAFSQPMKLRHKIRIRDRRDRRRRSELSKQRCRSRAGCTRRRTQTAVTRQSLDHRPAAGPPHRTKYSEVSGRAAASLRRGSSRRTGPAGESARPRQPARLECEIHCAWSKEHALRPAAEQARIFFLPTYRLAPRRRRR